MLAFPAAVRGFPGLSPRVALNLQFDNCGCRVGCRSFVFLRRDGTSGCADAYQVWRRTAQAREYDAFAAASADGV